MKKYTWIITRVFDENLSDELGTTGPRGADMSLIKCQISPQNFRMYQDGDGDDESIVTYEGILFGLDADGFEPLEDFGEPNAGCTTIAYWQKETPTRHDTVVEIDTYGGYWVML